MKNPGMMVSAILMIVCGILALVAKAAVNPKFINETLLAGLLLYVGLLLIVFGLLTALVAFIKKPSS